MDRNDISAAMPSQTTPNTDHDPKKDEAAFHLESVPTAAPTLETIDYGSDDWPTDDPDDPRNWPKWKKNAQIVMVAFHSMMSTFMAAGIVPGYDIFAEQYGVTVQTTSYLTSVQVCQILESMPSAIPDKAVANGDALIDLAPGYLPPVLETSELAIWPPSHQFDIGVGKFCLQYWRRSVHNVWHPDGHPSDNSRSYLAPNWYWQRRRNRVV